MLDPRIAPVEDNLDALLHDLLRCPRLTAGAEPDVATYWTDLAFPLFNAIGAARFAPGTVEQRAREVVASYVERGLPFLWWATPSGHAEELGPVLTGLGMQLEPIPGMHVTLTEPVAPTWPDGVEIRETDVLSAVPTVMAGFGFPDSLADDIGVLFDLADAEHTIQVVAHLDGEPAGCGMAWLTGTTVGLYNIATLESARGRGIGYAVTAALMDAALQRGCTEAILHASELGRPVYERLGFVEVCQVPQFVWLPPEAESEVVEAVEEATTVL